ncbi:uncharacterized protein SEPMUDRAFT_108656 [Sphaerulina musiva SO2202]|uniref:Uncharacterized protein n=1 Tax=Sphaerulina musiva (strain SO2202) TaxID=692275 RepID=N1QF70_SPHMS|nr:uncharacterized protein SEPMUDRAFT_108656 [Sphaerulina musiva SO2202]EMF11817.1 hypothetical protein SEPMUDRAFT_108656 [Sphaerulina musiva SO2202]
MSQLLRAPSKSVALFLPAVCFSSCKKCGKLESRADLAMLFMTLFYTTTLSTCTRRVTQLRPEKGPQETALKIQESTTMFLYALEMDIAITIEKQYESFEKLGLLFLYQGQKSSSKDQLPVLPTYPACLIRMFTFSDGTVDPLEKALMKQADAPIPHIMNGWLDACHSIATHLIASLPDVMRKGYLVHFTTVQRHKIDQWLVYHDHVDDLLQDARNMNLEEIEALETSACTIGWIVQSELRIRSTKRGMDKRVSLPIEPMNKYACTTFGAVIDMNFRGQLCVYKVGLRCAALIDLVVREACSIAQSVERSTAT